MKWWKVIIHCIGFLGIFLAAAIFVNPLTDGISNGTLRIFLKESLRLIITVGLFWLYSKKVLKKTNASFGIQRLIKADIKWVLIGLGMPLTVIVFYYLADYSVFEIQKNLSINVVFALLVRAVIVSCAAGVLEEMLFRGYLLKLIGEKWGTAAAIAATSVLFGALHLLTAGSLRLFDTLLILTAGTLVGMMFSLIVQKTGSLWNAAAVHAIWNFFLNPNIISFTHGSDNLGVSLVNAHFAAESQWVTGGAFGIEAGLPALILYSTVILWLVVAKPGKGVYERSGSI